MVKFMDKKLCLKEHMYIDIKMDTPGFKEQMHITYTQVFLT